MADPKGSLGLIESNLVIQVAEVSMFLLWAMEKGVVGGCAIHQAHIEIRAIGYTYVGWHAGAFIVWGHCMRFVR